MKRHDFSPEPALREYLVDYPYEGGVETLRIKALSYEDAELRLSRIQAQGELIGEFVLDGEVASMAVN